MKEEYKPKNFSYNTFTHLSFLYQDYRITDKLIDEILSDVLNNERYSKDYIASLIDLNKQKEIERELIFKTNKMEELQQRRREIGTQIIQHINHILFMLLILFFCFIFLLTIILLKKHGL